jgi:hypothetical protein
LVRRRAPLAELDLERNDDVAVVLETLADSRLVTVSEGTVEVAHEALLREWPRLREWIGEDADGRRLRRQITQAAAEWDADQRDEGELYRGARLAAALDWSTDHALDLNELEREFVSESRDASSRARGLGPPRETSWPASHTSSGPRIRNSISRTSWPGRLTADARLKRP